MTGKADSNARGPVLLERRDGVAHIRLNRPDDGNALTIELAHALRDAVRDANDDPDTGAVLLTGEGRLFCVGGDLRSMHAADDRRRFVGTLAEACHEAILELASIEKPVIAAVHGAAAGAGLSLVLVSDVVLATPRAAFVTAYTSVGLTPDCGQSFLLPRAIGMQRALAMTLLPRRIDGTEARDLGLVTELVEQEELPSAAQTMARRLADGPTLALGRARALIRSGSAAELREHLDREKETIAAAAATEAAGSLISAFLDSAK